MQNWGTPEEVLTCGGVTENWRQELLCIIIKNIFTRNLLQLLQWATIPVSEMVHCLATAYISLAYFVSLQFEKQKTLEI